MAQWRAILFFPMAHQWRNGGALRKLFHDPDAPDFWTAFYYFPARAKKKMGGHGPHFQLGRPSYKSAVMTAPRLRTEKEP
jgi:hypothetical protein